MVEKRTEFYMNFQSMSHDIISIQEAVIQNRLHRQLQEREEEMLNQQDEADQVPARVDGENGHDDGFESDRTMSEQQRPINHFQLLVRNH